MLVESCVDCFAAAAEAAAAAVRSGAKGAWQGHSGAVSGVAVDMVNHIMVSAGVDGLLVFWAFKEKRTKGAIAIRSGIAQLELVSAILILGVDFCDNSASYLNIENPSSQTSHGYTFDSLSPATKIHSIYSSTLYNIRLLMYFLISLRTLFAP